MPVYCSRARFARPCSAPLIRAWQAVRHSNELLMVPLRRRDGRGLRKRGITISLDELPERGATDDRSGRGGLRAIVPTMGEDEEADVGGGDGGNNQPPDQPPADLGAGL